MVASYGWPTQLARRRSFAALAEMAYRTHVRKKKAQQEQAAKLLALVESHSRPDREPETAMAFGHGVLEEVTGGVAPHISDSVFVLTDVAFYYQVLGVCA